MGIDLRLDLIEFLLDNFDVILGMDWLRKYKASIDCWLKKVSVRGSKGQRVTFKGFVPKNHTKIISVIKLKTYLRRNLPYDSMSRGRHDDEHTRDRRNTCSM